MTPYDETFRVLLKLGDGFAASCNLAGAVLRECERLGLPPPDAVNLSTMGPSMCWKAAGRASGRKAVLYTLYARETDVLCWDGRDPPTGARRRRPPGGWGKSWPRKGVDHERRW
jgi:hypothetical protein